jgi:hypothetical protein
VVFVLKNHLQKGQFFTAFLANREPSPEFRNHLAAIMKAVAVDGTDVTKRADKYMMMLIKGLKTLADTRVTTPAQKQAVEVAYNKFVSARLEILEYL